MKIDKSGYYPVTPNSSCDKDAGLSEEPMTDDVHAEEFSQSNDNLNNNRSENPEEPREHKGLKDYDDSGNIGITKACNVISWVFVPMLVSVYATILMFNLSSLAAVSSGIKLTFTLVVFGIDVAVPLACVYVLKGMGVVSDPGLNQRGERTIPYIIMILCYAGTAWFFWIKNAPMWVNMFYLGAAVAALINFVINFKWKISAHSTALAGVVALLLTIATPALPATEVWLVISILIAGLVGTARIYLQRHTLAQVLAGYAVGFTTVYCAIHLF